MLKLKLIFFLIFFSIFSFCVAQNTELDSLKSVLSKSIEDTNKVKTLLELSKVVPGNSASDALSYSILAKDLSLKLDYKNGLAFAYKNIGIFNYNEGNYLEAFDVWDKSLKAFEASNDATGVANMLSNLGAIYFNQGDDAKALDFYLRSLKVSDKLGDKLRRATVLNNIGAVYFNKKATQEKALEFYLKSLPLSEELGDNEVIGTTTVNLGEIYMDKGEFEQALKYFNQSLKVSTAPENIPYVLNDIGKLYMKQGEYNKAIQYQNEAYAKASKLNAKLDLAQIAIGLGDTYFKMGDIKAALAKYKIAEETAKELSAAYELKKVYEGLANCYSNLADYKSAYSYQNLLNNIKDTIYDIETDDKLSGLQFNFDMEKKQGQIDLLTKDKELQELDLQKQKVIRNVTIGGLGIVLLFFIVVLFQKRKITEEKKRSDELLLNILPAETAEELKATGSAKAKSFDEVTVMFTDFKNFTIVSEKLSAEELVKEINFCYSAFDEIVTKYGIEKIKTIGDSYMCAGGLPVKNKTHCVDVVRAALEMQKFIEKNKNEHIARGGVYLDLRLGIHTGPVVAGIVGIRKFAYDIWGSTVNIASRMESNGAPGKVNVSASTYNIIKDQFICVHRGKISAKNIGEIDMYFVEGEKHGA